MTRYRINPRIVMTEVESDLFLVNPDSEDIYHLNPVGAGIWRLLSEPMDEDAVMAVLGEAFPDIGEGPLRQDIRRVMGEMAARDLLRPA